MTRMFGCLSAVLLLGMPAAAQDVAGGGPADTVPVTKLKLSPANASVPALKYRLLPELRDLKPGNALMSYYRTFSPEWQAFQRNKEFRNWLEKWEDDRSKPPPEELRFVETFPALAELDIGARRAYCDWEMIERLRKDGLSLTIPDIQSFRLYVSLLSARARFEMLEKKFDKAAYTLQTGFALSRHISQGPMLIQALVGLANATIMLGEVEQLMQQPGSPNLYWPLTDLPTPLIDMRPALQGEKIMIDSLFPGWREMLADLNAKPVSQADAELLTKALAQLVGPGGRDKEKAVFRVGLAMMTARSYPEARKFLLDQGRPKELVDAMPVFQVAMLYEIYNYDRFYEDMIKWHGQPYLVMRKRIAESVQQLKKAKANMAPGTLLATILLPAIEKVLEASARTDRKVAGLRCVEAIRLYAATHGGKLPAALADITDVPVPVDPMSGSPFEYTVRGKSATLTAPPVAGIAPYSSWSYEITLQP